MSAPNTTPVALNNVDMVIIVSAILAGGMLADPNVTPAKLRPEWVVDLAERIIAEAARRHG